MAAKGWRVLAGEADCIAAERRRTEELRGEAGPVHLEGDEAPLHRVGDAGVEGAELRDEVALHGVRGGEGGVCGPKETMAVVEGVIVGSGGARAAATVQRQSCARRSSCSGS